LFGLQLSRINGNIQAPTLHRTPSIQLGWYVLLLKKKEKKNAFAIGQPSAQSAPQSGLPTVIG